MSERSSSRSRTIKLFCPSLSKFVPWVILEEEEKLDLGSIARTFGLEPSTLKLNRHFISRGIDLIASSVTWKSLLSFFASRGLSTGTNDSDALIVDGMLCKSGTKRTHMPPAVENGSQQTTIDYKDLANHKKLQVEDGNMLKKRKMNESKPDAQNGDHQTTNYHDLAINRRPLSEDAHPLKKRKLVRNNSGEHSHSISAKENHQTSHYKDVALNRRPVVEDVNLLKKRKITASNSVESANNCLASYFKTLRHGRLFSYWVISLTGYTNLPALTLSRQSSGAFQLSNGGTGGDEELNLPVKRRSWLGDFNPLKKIKMYWMNIASLTLVV